MQAQTAETSSRYSLAAEMSRAYVRPRRTMARQIEAGLSEGRAVLHLMVACLLYCAASVPGALRAAENLPVDDAATAAVASLIFAFVVVAPGLAYAMSALVKLMIGGAGLAVRSALFWALLLGAPIALLLSALSATLGLFSPQAVEIASLLAFAGWVWLAAASLGAASERRTWPIFVAVLGSFALVVFGVETL
ncbi:MAG: hypothetical protein AAGG56_08525 [Pseudomonadota bacterium]